MKKKQQRKPERIIVQSGGTSNTALWAVILLLFVVIAFGLYQFNEFRKANPLTTVGVTQIADIPPATTIEEVSQNIQDIEIEQPGPASEGVVATAVPWGTVLDVGDVERMRAELSSVYAAQGMDLRIAAALTTASSSAYCIHGHWPAGDPAIPLIDQVNSGDINLTPGTRYCVGFTKIGELWAGVPQSDLQGFTLNPIDYRVVDPEAHIVTTTQTIDVVVTARFGLLTHSVQPGNEVKVTFDRPAHLAAAWLDLRQEIGATLFGAPSYDGMYVQTQIDRADNLANELATLELIAPFFPDGGRDMKNLVELERLVRFYFNNPSPDPSQPWPYDHLRAQAELAAIQAGYQGLESFTVILEWPYEEGTWYYLQGLDTAPQLVIDPNDGVKFQDNLYPLWRSEIYTPPPPIPQN